MKTYRLFLGLLSLIPPAAEAQFNYTTYNGTAIITSYTGPGGALSIPSTLGGLPVTGIEGSGFENKGITTVAIPASVTNIEVQEFAPNDSLTSFTVDTNNTAYSSAGGVLFDKSRATLFEYPPGLTGSYTIPSSVTTVGQNAFAAAYFLSGVTIPTSVTNIGPTGFGYCFDLTSVTIPDSVTSIGPDAFINCYNLPAITVAAGNPSYISVGGVLFDKAETTLEEYPTGLDGNYTIPDGVTTVGTNAFILCDGLSGLTIPASAMNLADGAFAECAGLTNVILGAGVSYISASAFGGCEELVTINVNSNNPNFSSLDGVVLNKNQSMLVRFPPGVTGSYTTPGNVTSIADYAFQDCELRDVIISGNVASVGFYSFQGCGYLTNVTMSEGVVSIGEFAFGDCPSLASVTIPASVGSLPYGAFAYCDFGSVYFEGNAPVTDPSAFLGDSGTIYFLPGTSGWAPTFDGLATVLEGAPNPNGALEVMILPAGAANAGAEWQVDDGLPQPSGAVVLGLSVGPHTISFTTVSDWMAPSNQTISVVADVTNTASGTYAEEAAPASDFTFVTNRASITITSYVGLGGSVEIPSTINGLPVTAIGAQAFYAISTLAAVTIPDSVTNVGDNAFNSCAALAEVTVSDGVSNIGFGIFQDCFSLSEVTFRGAVTSIGDYAFASCFDLTGLTIQDSVTNLGQYAFYGTGLTNVTIPAGLTNIGEAAFLACSALPAIVVDPANPAYTDVAGVLFNKNQAELVQYPDGNPAMSYTISNTVTSIADTAFEDCNLTNITIATSVTNIGNYSFENCVFLAGVTIPNSVVSIGNEGFAFCNGLTNVVLPASVTDLGSIPFANCANMTAITAASGNPAYSSVNGVLYNKAGTLLAEYPGGVGGNLTIPNGVGDVGSQAVENCQITSVTIPGSVTNIENFGFSGCGALGSVIMTNGVTAIGVAAFQNCYVLTNVVLPPSLTNIGYSAFSDCSALRTVIIPSAAQILTDYAFSYCGSLVAAYFEGDAPPDDSTVFVNDSDATVYYLPGATGWNSTFGTAPTTELAGIAITANPSNGQAPLPVNFTAAATNSAGNPVTNWNWSFGDGSTSEVQNPSHTYTGIGIFSAAVVETNGAGVPVAGEVTSVEVSFFPVEFGISGVSVSGGNLVLDGTNGVAGATYVVLASTNLALPLSQWTPTATNFLGASGNFSITVSNAVDSQFSKRFYILQMDKHY
ncbi:MAG TPA: leucine-rich repeat protein [Verrucomicrobiae bacterium]|jgi:PKD repeat protein|nr:leucine-rich repeat protein [Verrucomicrobiae bacterium]